MKKLKTIRTIVLIAIFIFSMIIPAVKTHAAPLTAISDVMSRIKVGEKSNHTITFTTPTGVAATETITVQFPPSIASGEAGIDYTDVDFVADGVEITLAAVATGTTWGAVIADDGGGGTLNKLTLTSDSGTVAAGKVIVIEIGTNATGGDKQMQNDADAGTDNGPITAGSSDTGSIAYVLVADDQIVYSATVEPTISVVFSANASSFGTLSASSVSDAATPITVTIGTNADNGMTASVYDTGDATNPGLYKSTTTTDIIGSTNAAYDPGPTTLAAGTKGYGIHAATSGGSGGTITIPARFGTSSDVGGLEVGAAAAVTLASTNDPITGRIVTITAKAAIDNTTRAGSYSDTITVIVTGNF